MTSAPARACETAAAASYARRLVKEKDAASYRALVAQRDLDPQRTWMIGNSPKSDINPALALGLRAVYIPHPRTWSLEQQAILDGNGRLMVLTKFSELRAHF